VEKRGRKKEDAKTRFWEKVDKTDSCWNWIAGKGKGYGYFSVLQVT
jgi:hypothetical protein